MDEKMIALLAENGVHIGDVEARAALARRIAGFGVSIEEVGFAFWYMKHTKVDNVGGVFVTATDKGMESFKDYCECAAKVHGNAVKPEPGASLRMEDMERASYVASGRTYTEKQAKGIPMEQWTEGERERYAWDKEDEGERERYTEKSGEGKIKP
jgi:hypothetical protein